MFTSTEKLWNHFAEAITIGIPWKRCSWKFRKFLRKTPVLESLLESTGGYLKNRLQLRCFPVKFAKFLRTPILANIREWLLLTSVIVCIERRGRNHPIISINQHLLVQIQYWKHQNNLLNLFNVKHKGIRTTSGTWFWRLYS